MLKSKIIKNGPVKLTVAFNAEDDTPAEILIYDDIGKDPWTGEGITAKDIHQTLAEITPRTRPLTFRTNSRGGDVSEGLAIRSQLQDWPGRIVNVIDGVAASTASWMIPADEVHARQASQMFIHKSWALVMGNADDMRKAVDMLETTDGQIAQIYADKTGKPVGEMLAMMQYETLLTGQTALDLGLVDKLIDGDALYNFSDLEINAMKQKLAALNSQRISRPPNGGREGVTTTPPVKPQPQHQMSEPTQPAATPNPAPAPDFTPVIAAINALGDKIKTPIPEPPGAEPLGSGRVENLGNPAVEKMRTLKYDLQGRARFIRENYQEVLTELCQSQGIDMKNLGDRWDFRNPQVMNANTVDAGLANSILAADFVTTMRTLWAPLMAFTRSISPSPLSKRQVLNVPLVSSVGSMSTNATNYETGDTVAATIAVTVNEYNKSFHVSRPEQNLGIQLASLAPTNARVIGEGVVGLVTALMTNANYGADVVIGAAANFDATDLPAILALGSNYDRVTLLLDGGHLAYLLPTSRESFAFGEAGAYGFDGGIYKNNLWTNAAADIAGFVCGPDAIVIASGPPLELPAGEAISTSTTVIGDIPFQTTVWFSRASRAVWSSFTVMFGTAVGDATQAEVLTTA